MKPQQYEAHHNCPHQYYNDCAEHGPFTPAPQPAVTYRKPISSDERLPSEDE